MILIKIVKLDKLLEKTSSYLGQKIQLILTLRSSLSFVGYHKERLLTQCASHHKLVGTTLFWFSSTLKQ